MTKVLYLCNSNRGKSQMAAALHRLHAPDWQVYSAGVEVAVPGAVGDVNQESAESLARIGANMWQQSPQPLDMDLARQVDYVIVVGGAKYDGPAIRWDVEDPASRGIKGQERMDLLRDAIDAQVQAFIAQHQH